MCSKGDIIKNVKDYYGKQLLNSDDLLTNACKITTKKSDEILEAEKYVPEEVKLKYFGCGLISPDHLEKCRIIDLGCGTGHDCFILSQLSGVNGEIIGIDMTEESLNVAKRGLIEFQEKTSGRSTANIKFEYGYLEELPTESNYFDIAVSNCVINLCSNKEDVIRECYRVLKFGGELYFSDLYCDKKINENLKNDILWSNGLSGALVWKELFDIAANVGLCTPRMVEVSEIEIDDKIKNQVDGIRFASVKYRIFKIKKEEKTFEKCHMRYLGDKSLIFDYWTQFCPNEVIEMDFELFSILMQSRYCDLFELMNSTIGNEVTDAKVVKLNKASTTDPFQYLSSAPKPGSCCSKKKCC